MKEKYEVPFLTILLLETVQMVCLSLTGGTESMSQSDMEDLIFDDPFVL